MKHRPRVKLIGEDGNAFNILGICRQAAKKANWTDEQWAEFETKPRTAITTDCSKSSWSTSKSNERITRPRRVTLPPTGDSGGHNGEWQ